MTRCRGWIVAAATLTAAVALSACGPPTPPAPQLSWQATTAGIDTGDDEMILTATSTTWWANVRTDGGSSGPATLQLHARTGPYGVPAATPTQEVALGQFATDLAMSEHLLVVRMRDVTGTAEEYRVFELDTTSSTWALAASVPLPALPDASTQVDLSDDTLVIGHPFTFGGGPDGDVRIVPLDRSGPGVTWSPASVQTFTPDPSWSIDERAKYGHQVAVEGDTVVFGAGERVVVLRRSGVTWAADAELLDAAGPGSGFARSLAVDESGGTPRVLVGVQGRFQFGVPRPGEAQLFQRTGSGWSLAHTFLPDPAGALGGFAFGANVALDGTRYAFGIRWMQVAPTAGGVIDDYQLELRELRGGNETAVSRSLLDLVGGVDAGWGNVGPFSIDLAGSHLAVSGFAQPTGGSSRYFTVSYDRRPA
ncbi:MAG: hypothetical protein ACYC2O_02430 [Microthrixaceae bacterium]